MIKKIQQATKIRVKDRTLILTVSVVIIIAFSMVIASLLPSSSLGNFGSKPGGDLSPLATGYCVYNFDMLSHRKGGLATFEACKSIKADPMYGTTVTGWYAFCPGMSGADGDAGKCNCSAPKIEKSDRLKNGIDGREGMIESLNNGALTQDDINNRIDNNAATALRCACGVRMSDWGHYVFNNDGTPVMIPVYGSATATAQLYDGGAVKGTFDFVTKVNKMFSRMDTYKADTFSCEFLPHQYGVSGSWSEPESDDGLRIYNNHSWGLAADLCRPISLNDTACNLSRVEDVIKKITDFDTNKFFSILRECTATERVCNGTKGCAGGLVHIDTRPRTPDFPGAIIQRNCVSTNR